MGVQTCVSSRSSQAFVVSIGDMFISAWVFVSLCEAVVNNMDVMLALADSDKIVIRFDVAV